MSKFSGYVKTALLRLTGQQFTSYIQAARFAWKIGVHAKADPEFAVAKGVLSLGDTAIDVGANGADWTNVLSRCVGKCGGVYAFEADSYYAASTAITIRMLGLRNVRFFPFGLSDRHSNAQFSIIAPNGIRLSGEGHVATVDEATFGSSCTIELRTLDSVLEDNLDFLARLRLIKIDVEGFEIFVLKGMRKTIDSSRPVIILEVGNYARYGYDESELVAYMNTFKYEGLAITKKGLIAKTDSSLRHDDALGVNRILAPMEKVPLIERIVVKTAIQYMNNRE